MTFEGRWLQEMVTHLRGVTWDCDLSGEGEERRGLARTPRDAGADAAAALSKARKDLVAAKTRKSQVDGDLETAKKALADEEAKEAKEATRADAPPPPADAAEAPGDEAAKEETATKEEATPPPKVDSVVKVRVNALTEKALQAAVAECSALQAVEDATATVKVKEQCFFERPAVDAAAVRAREDEMCAKDAAVKAVGEKRNALETCVLELRSAKNGKHYKLFEEHASAFGALLDAGEEYLWSEEAEQASAEDMQAKLDALRDDARKMAPAGATHPQQGAEDGDVREW